MFTNKIFGFSEMKMNGINNTRNYYNYGRTLLNNLLHTKNTYKLYHRITHPLFNSVSVFCF